jgi:predicted heme/steroid binding protein
LKEHGEAMDEFEMKRRIYGYIKEICHYSQMQVFATSYYQKNYFQMQIDDATSALISLYMDLRKTPESHRRSHVYHNQDKNLKSYEQTEEQGAQANQIDGQTGQPDGMPSVEEGRIPEQVLEENQPIVEPPGEEPSPGLEEPGIRRFTPEELANYDGKDGRPAYVAVNGEVYDVSGVTLWSRGQHFGMQAGRDLSGPFGGCHQGITDRLNRLPKVGVLIKGV